MYSATVRKKTALLNSEEISSQFVKILKVKSIDLTSRWKQIEIKNLNFSYHGNDNTDLHLDNVSISIGNGEKIAFVGESGSGKTTMLKIIRELYTPKSIDITLDGKAILGGFTPISENISLIPQDPEIFNSTIKHNITMGHDYKMSVIKKYTDMAMFTEVAERLPKKYESSIVEKGVNLSGGEKQRLALTRGLLASTNKSIILLDEPTSSVDTKNELEIYKNIFNHFKDKTVISSIHRLHLLPLFDKIYLFESGKIIESGSFEELKEKSETFKNMWNKYSGITRIA
jgi:ABC-type multidrug transport system fused ATPase/permease subunit